MKKYRLVENAVRGQPWAILEEKLAVIDELVQFRVDGGTLSAEEIAAKIDAAREPKVRRVRGNVAIIPIQGVIAQKMDLMTAMSGGTSTEAVGRDIDAAVADRSISAIVFDVDSPGGSVYGVTELADKIYNARASKKIYAVSNSVTASAAYWLASQAHKIYVTPGGEIGSIGVIAAHTDVSGAEAAAGFKTTIVKAGRFKGEGNPHEPLGDEAHSAIQKRVDEYYGMFAKAVARGRDTTTSAVRGGYGQGRMVGADEAVSVGLADGIKTLDALLSDLAGQSERASAGVAAAAELIL